MAGKKDDRAQQDNRAQSPEARRRRLAAELDDAVPGRTRDETSEGWGERDRPAAGESDDDWLRRQVPPHHG